MNDKVIANFSKLKASLFFIPILLLVLLILFLYSHDALSKEGYVLIQKDYFYFINSKFSKYPTLVYNITQLGDCLVLLSLLSIFMIKSPKIWECIISAWIVSGIFSRLFKDFFHIPRPAEAFGRDNIAVVGKVLPGFSSLPSGHSISIFTTITILMYAFMPQRLTNRILWVFSLIVIGLLIASTRVGVGAHHPLDVIFGCITGYCSGLIGIFISRKYKIWAWISNEKYYPVFILLFTVFSIILVTKIVNENLIVFYLSLMALVFSLYKISMVYAKR